MITSQGLCISVCVKLKPTSHHCLIQFNYFNIYKSLSLLSCPLHLCPLFSVWLLHTLTVSLLWKTHLAVKYGPACLLMLPRSKNNLRLWDWFPSTRTCQFHSTAWCPHVRSQRTWSHFLRLSFRFLKTCTNAELLVKYQKKCLIHQNLLWIFYFFLQWLLWRWSSYVLLRDMR